MFAYKKIETAHHKVIINIYKSKLGEEAKISYYLKPNNNLLDVIHVFDYDVPVLEEVIKLLKEAKASDTIQT